MFRFNLVHISLSLLITMLAAHLHAGQVVDIYRAQTLVKSQSETERNAAARAMFGEVIVRVSGQRSALNHPVIKQALNKAENYLFGFSYHSASQSPLSQDKPVKGTTLELNYSPKAIENLLRQAQLPLWPAQRPKVLVWLVARDTNGLHLVPPPEALQAMQAQAFYRGLPLVLPKMDMEDNLVLGANEVWQLDIAKIKAASIRYKVDAILVGRYSPSVLGPLPQAKVSSDEPASASQINADQAVPLVQELEGPWLGSWQLIHSLGTQNFDDETPEISGLFEAAIDHATDYFATQYAIVSTQQGPQTHVINLSNVKDFGSFKRAQAYLNRLAMVRRLDVLRVSQEDVLVGLTTDGDAKLLVGTLALGKRLIPVEQPTASGSPETGGGMEAEQSDKEELSTTEPALGAPTSAVPAPDLTPRIVPLGTGSLADPLLYIWQK